MADGVTHVRATSVLQGFGAVGREQREGYKEMRIKFYGKLHEVIKLYLVSRFLSHP